MLCPNILEYYISATQIAEMLDRVRKQNLPQPTKLYGVLFILRVLVSKYFLVNLGNFYTIRNKGTSAH